jgi:hypothetical protein
MTMIRKSMKTTGLMTGLLLLGSVLAPFANAGHVVCYDLGHGMYLCYWPQ